MRWFSPVIPALWEAEAGESLELGKGEAAVSRDHDTALQLGQHSNKTRLHLEEKKGKWKHVHNVGDRSNVTPSVFQIFCNVAFTI